MYGKRTYRKRRPVAKKARRVSRKSSSTRKSITKIVKSVISRQAENKIWIDYGINQTIPVTVGNVPVSKNLVPLLTQGTTKSNRIGNEINVKGGYVRGHVNLLPYDVTLNSGPIPVWLRIWILTCKQENTTNLSSTFISSNFLDINTTTVGLQGNMLDMDLPVSKDNWIVHTSKTIKLGVGAITSVGPVGTNGYYEGSSSFSVPFYFNIGKYLKKIKYDDNNNFPTNKNMFIVFQAVPANGSNGGNQIPAEFHYTTRITYEDM